MTRPPGIIHLAAISASLSDHGITSRLTRIGGTPVLTIDAPGTEEDPTTIAIDPDTHAAPELRLDCTCIWTPAPGATPQATAATITAVLNALRPAPGSPYLTGVVDCRPR